MKTSTAVNAGLIAGLAAFLPSSATAYDFLGGAWPTGDVRLELSLHLTPPHAVPAAGFIDGTQTWNDPFVAAVNDWNAVLKRIQLVANSPSTAPAAPNNRQSNIYFTDDIDGEAFGERVLAVTRFSTRGVSVRSIVESDILVNRGQLWNSYRGTLRRDASDLKRVALHELGHLLGLTHPDEAAVPQEVDAVMNSTTSNTDSLQADDIAGIRELYEAPLVAPRITRDLVSQTVPVGGKISLNIDVNGQPAPAETQLQKYVWLFQPPGGEAEILTPVQRPDLTLGAAQLDDAGTYAVVVENVDDLDISSEVKVTVTPIAQTPATRLANLSTRGLAGTGDRALIVGFVLAGDTPHRVLVRAVGATLRQPPFNLGNALANPSLIVYDADKNEVARNDNWQTPVGNAPASAAALSETFGRVGAFALGEGSADAAVLVSLPPGSYTAVIDGNGEQGVAIVELYDADLSGTTRLVNLATRGFVGTGGDILIAGLNVNGPGARTYLIRVIGDTLQDFGLTGTLDDPVVTLFDGTGAYLRENDDWDSPEFLQPSLRTTMAAVGAFEPTDRQESVMRLTLPPGSYTFQVKDWGGGDGIGLVEVYELPLSTP